MPGEQLHVKELVLLLRASKEQKYRRIGEMQWIEMAWMCDAFGGGN
jgi:hypothetical protein